MSNGRSDSREIPANRMFMMGRTLVFSKATDPPTASEDILLAIPEHALIDAERVQP